MKVHQYGEMEEPANYSSSKPSTLTPSCTRHARILDPKPLGSMPLGSFSFVHSFLVSILLFSFLHCIDVYPRSCVDSKWEIELTKLLCTLVV
jgi:hypothetical protein